jgi:hypothetical protein
VLVFLIGRQSHWDPNGKLGRLVVGIHDLWFHLSLPRTHIGTVEIGLLNFGQEAIQFGMPASMIAALQLMRQTILNLQGDFILDSGETIDPAILKGRAFDQDETLAKMDGQAKSMTLRDIRTFQLMLSCIYGDFHKARHLVDESMSYSLQDLVEPRKHIRLVYLGLAVLAVGRERGWRPKCKYLSLGRKILKIFQVETESGSVNSHPILQMMQAEEHQSNELYEIAIKSTGRSGLRQHQAYMYERLGLFLQRQKGDDGTVEFYLGQVCQLYSDWGAYGKMEQLQGKYAFLSDGMGTSSSFSSWHSQFGSSLQGRTRHEKGLTERMMRFSIEVEQPTNACS